jgi:Response regulator containing a CheY-like receiver domain and an HTH DNA-binding domain
MQTNFSYISRKKTKVTILATQSLVRQSLQLMLDGDRELSVLDAVAAAPDLIEKVSHRSPDVVLLCLMDNEGKNIEVMSELRRVAPQIKAVVLSSPKSLLDQPAALKLGVTGIVWLNQSPRVLIRAIRQVAEGEVWLNQKLLAQLLDGNYKPVGESSRRKNSYAEELTMRELEVVGMIGLGMNNKDISKRLYISEATVRHHLSSIYGKLNVEDRLNLAIYAHQRQIVPPQSAGRI